MAVTNMRPVRYHMKDLKLVRRNAVKAEQSIARQEDLLENLRLNSRSLDMGEALLSRLYDSQRRLLYRVKLIEAALNVKA